MKNQQRLRDNSDGRNASISAMTDWGQVRRLDANSYAWSCLAHRRNSASGLDHWLIRVVGMLLHPRACGIFRAL